jgi:hypothetical protein
MPVPQQVHFIVGWAGEPAHKKLIENGALGVSLTDSTDEC